MGIRFVLIVLALICFIIKALGLNTGQFDMTAAGFAFLTATLLAG